MKELLDVIEKEALPARVIVVNDGSSDGTSLALAPFSGRLRVIEHAVNRGYGASLKTGFREAETEWCVIVDCDSTYPVKQLPDLWAAALAGEDMVVGARDRSGIPLIRRPPKWFLRRLASWMCGYPIPDLNSGFRFIRRSLVARYYRLLPDTFSFTSTITMAALRAGFRVRYVPIAYMHRKGDSKIHPFRDPYRFFMLILRTALYFDPLKVFMPSGFILMLLSCALIVHRALVEASFNVVSILFFVSGLQFVGLGLLADLINRRGSAHEPFDLHDEARGYFPPVTIPPRKLPHEEA